MFGVKRQFDARVSCGTRSSGSVGVRRERMKIPKSGLEGKGERRECTKFRLEWPSARANNGPSPVSRDRSASPEVKDLTVNGCAPSLRRSLLFEWRRRLPTGLTPNRDYLEERSMHGLTRNFIRAATFASLLMTIPAYGMRWPGEMCVRRRASDPQCDPACPARTARASQSSCGIFRSG